MAEQMKIITVPVEYMKEIMRVIIREEFEVRDAKKPKEEKLYTSKEVMEILKISESTFRRYTKQGIIKASKINGRIRVSEKNLAEVQKEIKSLKYKRS